MAEKVKLKKNQMSWEIRICLWQKESKNKNLEMNNILRSKNLCVAEKVKVKTKEKKLNVLRNKKLSVAEKHQRALFTLKLHNVLQLSWIARVLLLSQNIRTKFKMPFHFLWSHLVLSTCSLWGNSCNFYARLRELIDHKAFTTANVNMNIFY